MSSVWTLAELPEEIARWKAAYRAASTGKSYTIGNRTLTRHDLNEIRAQLDYLGGELAALERGRGPVFVRRERWRGW